MVSKSPRIGVAVAALLAVGAIAGCSNVPGRYDEGFRATDAVGQWTSEGHDQVVVLNVQSDGTFSAEGWPRGLYCDGAVPERDDDPDDLWDDTVDFSGTWRGTASDDHYTVRFVSLGPECRTNFPVVAWRLQDGPAVLRVDLSPLTPVEELTENEILYLKKS